MFGINEILKKVINRNPLTEEEKFKILRSKRIDKKVVEYLIDRLSQLHIEVLGEYEGSLFELMPVGKLEGWCFQTTESAIVFFDDNDYIERGNLKFDERTPMYYHSWICFYFNGTEYVLDPCLSFLCKKDDYSKIFETDAKGKVTAKAVRDELIRQINLPKKEDNSEIHKSFEIFLKSSLGDYQESKKEEVIVYGPEDVNAPLYRNGAGYKTEINGQKIKRMTVHYYYTDL